MRCVRRRKAASERWRSSSPERARHFGGGSGLAAASRARTVVVVFSRDNSCTDRQTGRLGGRVIAAETFACLKFRLALGFLFVRAPGVFLAFARFGGFALLALGGFAPDTAARFILGNFSFFRFAHARIG
jgi:hypothetical protein